MFDQTKCPFCADLRAEVEWLKDARRVWCDGADKLLAELRTENTDLRRRLGAVETWISTPDLYWKLKDGRVHIAELANLLSCDTSQDVSTLCPECAEKDKVIEEIRLLAAAYLQEECEHHPDFMDGLMGDTLPHYGGNGNISPLMNFILSATTGQKEGETDAKD